MAQEKEYVLRLTDFERRLLLGLMTESHNQLLRSGKPTEDVANLMRRIISAPLRSRHNREQHAQR